ncbi:peptidylprolyl isomerase [Hyphomonas oceanitis]|uniref:peptidylprolyl isomerase n=1 Tax=Hyphomonas oceanitis TaxID=81033 RepID=UPI0030036FF4
MRSLLREPLVHFVLVAALVFAGHAAWTAYADARDGTITVTEEDMERMAALYASESGALPSPEDMAAMVTDQVRDEALAREARRLGLDVGDTIIERRLAQKMSFMVSDLADTPAPSEATLRKWYEDHKESYTLPPSITFEHVYLNPERSGNTPGMDSESLLKSLNGPTPVDWRTLGDPFMLQRAYGNLPIRETVRLFGADFARALFSLKPGPEWQGPVSSAFGQHLVHIVALEEGRLPPFEDVRAKVESDWHDEALRAANDKAIADIIKHYKVRIEGAE